MNVSLVPDKYLIVYYSLSGNTKGVVNVIENFLKVGEKYFDILPLQSKIYHQINIEEYTHVFVGTPTYGNGSTPKEVLDYLRYILKDNQFILPTFSVFGTGDTQWISYCKAVDELEYHLSKKTTVTNKLKIEQYPISDFQVNKINEFVNIAIRR